MISIRRRMLIILLSAFFLVWAVATAATIYNVRAQMTGALDERIHQNAYYIWLRALQSRENNYSDIAELTQSLAPTVSRFQSFAFQVWDGKRLIAKSDNAPDLRMSKRPAFSYGRLNGRPWRFFYRVDAYQGVDVIVGAEDKFSGDVAKSIGFATSWPILLALPFVAIAIVWGVNSGLRPLRDLAGQITERTPTQMTPIEESQVPKEVRGIVRALNELLKRLEAAMADERRFAANASHELRTPLAAIEVQSKVALSADDNEERNRALGEIRANVVRARRLIEQLLTLARLDPEQLRKEHAAVDLHALVQHELSEISAAAFAKNIDISMEGTGTAYVSGDRDGLSILVRNILDNAVRYSPEGGALRVTVAPDRERIGLRVQDSGPGITGEERDKVFDRFYRILGTPSTGAGLGLSIVAKIADLHNATVRLDNNTEGPGLDVRILFPSLSGAAADQLRRT